MIFICRDICNNNNNKILKFTWHLKGPQNNPDKEQSWRTHTSWFQNTPELHSSKRCGAGIQTDIQTNGTGLEPGNKPSYVRSNVFWRGCPGLWGKDGVFDKRVWGNGISTCKRMKLDSYLTPYAKIDPKSIKEPNIRVGRKIFRSEGWSTDPKTKGKRGLGWRERLSAFLNTCFGTGSLQKWFRLIFLKFLWGRYCLAWRK